MRFPLALAFLLALTGCGPMFVPMTPRLSPEDQRTVDQMWDNMLTPVERVDRQTLLDANIAYWMYTLGVDRLHMKSEKYFHGGTAVMEVDCDRANPDIDAFTITVLDERGRTVRRERYSRAEVEESSQALHGLGNLPAVTIQTADATTQPTTQATEPGATQPATAPAETAEQRRKREECELRQAAVIAATQPARVAPITGSRGPR